MTKKQHILFIDDEEDILFAGALLLRQEGYSVATESNPERLVKRLAETPTDLVLLDMNFRSSYPNGNEGLYWLNTIKSQFPDKPVIMITAFGDIDLAVKAIQSGAANFVTKPWQNSKLLETVNITFRQIKAARDKAPYRQKAVTLSAAGLMLGESAAIRQVKETIRKVAPTEANVLILGENGTGKELVARSLHEQSRRAPKVFVTVDMGAITESLFESELFGHKKGAFTDAREDHTGKFEQAQNGTLFLDEIGNLPLSSQSKLLTAIQSRTINKVGSGEKIPLDIRIISATNAELAGMVEQKQFRQDLLYRLNTVSINLPPLRERAEDIPLLTAHFLAFYSEKYREKALHLSKEAQKKLQSYHWPGNVRELQHVVERAVILSENNELEASDFILEAGPAYPLKNDMRLEELEKEAIVNALRQFQGNVSEVARKLGLSRAALYRRMEKYGL